MLNEKRKTKVRKHVLTLSNALKFLPIIAVMAVVLFLGVGYASITSTFTMTGSVGSIAQSGLFITNITMAASSGSTTNQTIKTYYSTLLTNYIYLDSNGSSYVIYKIEVKNKNTSAYKLTNLSYDPSSQLGTYTNEYIVPTIMSVSDAAALNLSTVGTIGVGDSVAANGGTANFYVKYAYDPSIVSGGTVASAYQTLSNGVVNYNFTLDSGGGGSGTPTDPYIDSTTTVANFDPGNQTPGTSVVYEAIDGQPQVTTDSNGNVTSFAYTDTSGVSMDDGAIDTHYVPFDGTKDFEIYIKAQFPPTLNNNNGSTSTALGVLLDVRDRTVTGSTDNNLQVTYSKNGTVPSVVVGKSSYNTGLATISGLGNNIFEATITYNHPTTPNGSGQFVIVYNKNGTDMRKTVARTPDLPAQSVFLGYTINKSGTIVRRAQGTTVYEFHIKDI